MSSNATKASTFVGSTVGKSVSPQEAQARKIGVVLQEILDALRSTAISRDFFEGYSLAEAVQERLDIIGGEDSDPSGFYGTGLTLLAELDKLEREGLEAIKAARDLPALEEKNEVDADVDPVQIGNSEVYVVEA